MPIVPDAKACLLVKESGERGARGGEKKGKWWGGEHFFFGDESEGEGEIRTDGRGGGRYKDRGSRLRGGQSTGEDPPDGDRTEGVGMGWGASAGDVRGPTGVVSANPNSRRFRTLRG